MVPISYSISKQTIYQMVHHSFGHELILRLLCTENKVLIEGFPNNFPDFEEPCTICIPTKKKNPTSSYNWHLRVFSWYHPSNGIVLLWCWKNTWIYLYFCIFILIYLISLWFYTKEKEFTSPHTKIYCYKIDKKRKVALMKLYEDGTI